MPIFPHFIGGPFRGLDAQTIVSLAMSMGVNKNNFYRLLVRHEKLRQNVWKTP